MVSTNIQFFEGNLGIQNSSPSHDLSVGSNLHVEDTGSNVLAVVGNVSVANTLILGELCSRRVPRPQPCDWGEQYNHRYYHPPKCHHGAPNNLQTS